MILNQVLIINNNLKSKIMKSDLILERIQTISSVEALPAKTVIIKKVSLIKDFKELKNKIPFLKKAILCNDKILF